MYQHLKCFRDFVCQYKTRVRPAPAKLDMSSGVVSLGAIFVAPTCTEAPNKLDLQANRSGLRHAVLTKSNIQLSNRKEWFSWRARVNQHDQAEHESVGEIGDF